MLESLIQVVVDKREPNTSIDKKKKPDVLQAHRFSFCEICYRRERFFNKLTKYFESVR